MTLNNNQIDPRFRLLKLPEEVQIKVADGTLSPVDVEVLSQFDSPDDQIKAAAEIAKAKRHRRKPSEGRTGRKFRYRKTKAQINRMIAKLMDHGIDGLTTRALAWAAGSICDDEFEEDIRRESTTEPAAGRRLSRADRQSHQVESSGAATACRLE